MVVLHCLSGEWSGSPVYWTSGMLVKVMAKWSSPAEKEMQIFRGREDSSNSRRERFLRCQVDVLAHSLTRDLVPSLMTCVCMCRVRSWWDVRVRGCVPVLLHTTGQGSSDKVVHWDE